MINKKNLLGKAPFDLGDKDAIHVAIVAVRAASSISPGRSCSMNEFGEAFESDDEGVGVADPFRKAIARGDSFWLLLNQDEVPNVRHVWEHPKVKFDAPTRPIEYNRCLVRSSEELKVSYSLLMEACEYVVANDESFPYPGEISASALDQLLEDANINDVWYEWAEETGYEFENEGSACCPEYCYPDTPLFCVKK